MQPDSRVRLRFAPSPTGHLHIGGARTALFNWLLARNMGGTFVLRIEDTDLDRSTAVFEAEILRDLTWLGLDWDEGPMKDGPLGPYRQSERIHLYVEATEKLIATGHAYRCTCTTERLEAVRQAALQAGKKTAYDGFCRERGLGPDCGSHVVRFRMPAEGECIIDDLVKGRVVIQNEELDDFVIRRSDGGFTYNFVVVVDDNLMGITHVLRGDDHLANTPKQINLYRAMGATPPAFGHMPLILGPDGARLSKRHGATSVGSYQEMGYLPEAIINYLARLGWSHGNMELFDMKELLSVFVVHEIGVSAGRWDSNKLLWVNQHWLQRLPEATIAACVLPFLRNLGVEPDADAVARTIPTVRSRARTLPELAEMMLFYFVADDDIRFDEAAARKFLGPSNAVLLEGVVEVLEGVDDWTQHGIESSVTSWIAPQGIGLGTVAQPIRVCITGRKVGPGLFETLEALGKEHTIARLRKGIQRALTPSANE